MTFSVANIQRVVTVATLHPDMGKRMGDFQPRPPASGTRSRLSRGSVLIKRWLKFGASGQSLATARRAIILSLLACLGLAGCFHGDRTGSTRTHKETMQSLPPAVASLPVEIVPSLKHPVLAWSTSGMMGSYISYNPRLAKRLPPEVLAFALVHEFGHLQLQHIERRASGDRSPSAIRQQELEADRFAARFWATHDPKVAAAAAAAFLSPTARKSLGSEPSSIRAGYPTQAERAQAIRDYLAMTQMESTGGH